MPIAAADLVKFLSASVPDDDTSTSGGAIDTAARPLDGQLASNSVIEVLSDGADTRTVTIEGRNAAGAIATDPIVLNGTTPVAGAVTFERVLKATLSAADASRTVTVRHSDDTVITTLPPNITKRWAHFKRSASESGATLRYEKDFWRNGHASLTLNSAAVKLTADPAAVIKIGLHASKDDTATVANRKTAPASVTFVDDNVSQTVPGGTLEAASRIGTWIELSLIANQAPVRNSYTTELSGTSV